MGSQAQVTAMPPPRALEWPFKQHGTQLIGAVTAIDFCAAAPHDYCVSAGTRLQVYDGASSAAKRQFTRFKDKAYSGCFRSDGKLVVAGGEDSVVQLFDAGSRTLLRQFKGHKGPVHVARFAADNLHVLTGGDDGLAAMWDITSGLQVTTFRGHTDYVRCAANNPTSEDVWATSGYDHVCKLWDARQSRCLASMDHGAPIEAVAFFPSGSLLVTAGSTDLCIWHMLHSGQLLQRITAHQKTATSVVVTAMAGAEPHIMSAGLDGHVKAFDAETYRPTTVHKYPVPVLALAAAPTGSSLAVGMADGTLSIHRRRQQDTAQPAPARLRWRPERLTGARSHYAAPKRAAQGAKEGDAAVAAQAKVGIPRYEELLLRFRFTDALDAALATQRHEPVGRVVDALTLQGALESTLAAAPPDLVASLLQHVRRQLSSPVHVGSAVAVTQCLLTGSAQLGAVAGDSVVQARIQQLRSAVAEELRTQEQLQALKGIVGAVMHGAA